VSEAVSRAGVIEILIEGNACLQDKSNCLVKRVVTHVTKRSLCYYYSYVTTLRDI